MKLISNYIYAVTKQIAPSQRDDVARELKATIEDMLADRFKGKNPTNDEIKEILMELGNPNVLAQQYGNSKQYLIGPQWFELYKQVLFTVLKIVPLVIFGISLVKSLLIGESLLSTFGQAIVNSWNVAILIAFWVTVTFFVLERTNAKPQAFRNELHLDDLPEPPKARQIKVFEIIFEILFSLAFWIILFFSSDILGKYTQYDGIAVINPALWKGWIIILLALVIIDILHKCFQLVVGNWTKSITVSKIILSLVMVAYPLLLVSTQTLINPELVDAIKANGVTRVNETIAWSTNITIAIIICVGVWDIAESIIKHRKYIQTKKSQTIEVCDGQC